MFTFERVGGLVRHGLTTLGGYLVGKGYLDESTMLELVGAGMTIIGFLWSWWNKPKPTATP